MLGKAFSKQGLAALTGLTAEELEPLLASLLRKEILSVQADPRAPERGQYAFLQDIVKRVAYETLARSERRARHLAAAAFLERAFGAEEDEVVEVVAAHYLSALDAAPEHEDAAELRERARTMLVRAAERAGSLAAHAEAQRAYERAAALAEEPVEEAELLERAGVAARNAVHADEAKRCFERAIALFEQAAASHAAARVEARLAEAMWDLGRIEEGLDRMNRSFELLSREPPDADLAALAAQLGRFLYFGGQPGLAAERTEAALVMAESLVLPEVLASALTTKGVILFSSGRRCEGLGVLRLGLETAVEHDKPSAALRASFNLADMLGQSDRYAEAAEVVRDGLDHARRVGNRYWEVSFLGQLYPFLALGAWDEALEMLAGLPDEWEQSRQAYAVAPLMLATVHAYRGTSTDASAAIERFVEMETSGDAQERTSYAVGLARSLLSAGDAAAALRYAQQALTERENLGIAAESVKEAFVVACEAGLALGEDATVDGLVEAVESLSPGDSTHFLQAQASRFRGLLVRAVDPTEGERHLRRATALLRELSMPLYLALAQAEQAELLGALGRRDEAETLLVEAREAFERLGATPWVERVGTARAAASVEG